MNWLSVIVAFICGLIHLSACVSAAKVVQYAVTRASSENGHPSVRRMSRRDNIGQTLVNNVSQGAYYASIQVGTPVQNLSLILGTSNSDTWVIDASASACSNTVCITPFYPNSSQTISTVAAGGFNFSYLGGDYAKGDYIKEEIAIGEVGQARMILQMGLATNLSNAVANLGGILGLGYDGGEATTNATNNITSVPYPNFMDLMVHNHLINTKLFSLWLNDLGSSTGSILFGGIDTEKYYGTLYSMPIHPDRTNTYSDFVVNLTSLSIKPHDGSTIFITNSSFSAPVVLSLSTLIYLPDYIVNATYKAFHVAFSADGNPYVDCKYSNSSYISFGFESGSVINVAYSEFVNKLYVPSQPLTDLPFTDICSMGILSVDSPDSYFFLGDFFLRSAYVVYDLANNRIGMAQSNLNSTTSNVVEVVAGAASIPQVTGVALPSPTTTSSTGKATSTSSTSSTSSKPPTDTSSPSNHKAVAIGVGVAVPMGVILAALAGFFCFWRRRRQASPTSTQHPDASPAEVAGSEVKYIYENELASEPVSPTKHNISELPSPHNSIQPASSSPSASPPQYGHSHLSAITRKPLNSEGLHEHTREPEERPLSGTASGPLEDMPSLYPE